MDAIEKTANEKRLIDGVELRRRIIAFATGMHSEVLPIDTVMMLLMQTPTVDAVEVVRCKDCCSCLIDNSIREHHLCMRGYPLLQKRVKLDDFCSYGEREEGAD